MKGGMQQSGTSNASYCPVCQSSYFRRKSYVEDSEIRSCFAHWTKKGNVKVCIGDINGAVTDYEPVKRKSMQAEEFDRIFC